MKEKSLLQLLNEKQARRIDITDSIRKERARQEAAAAAIKSPVDQKRRDLEERVAQRGEEQRRARATAERRFWEEGRLAESADADARAVKESNKASRKVRYTRPEF